MLNQHYQESRTPAVWLCVRFTPKEPESKTRKGEPKKAFYHVALKKVGGKVGVGEIMELTAENHAQNIERGVYFITEKP